MIESLLAHPLVVVVLMAGLAVGFLVSVFVLVPFLFRYYEDELLREDERKDCLT